MIGVAATVAVTAWVARGARAENEERFEQSAQQAAGAIESQVRLYFDELHDIGAFVVSADHPTEAQFARYVDGTGVFEQFPSLVGVIFLHRVTETRYDGFVEEFRAGADPDFAPYSIDGTSPRKPVSYIVTYYAPGDVDLELPIGAEVTPIRSITGVLEAGVEAGSGAAGSFQSDPRLIELAEETDYEPLELLLDLDFFIGVPVYQAPPAETEATTEEPVGWVAAPTANFDEVLDQASSDLPQDLGLTLTVDLTAMGVRNGDFSRVAEREGDAGPRSDAAFVDEDHEFSLDGVDWSLTVWSSPGADQPGPEVLLLGIGGMLATVLAATVIYLRYRELDRERSLAAEVAEREQFQRDILDSVESATVVLDRDGHIVAANHAWWMLRGETPDRDERGPDLGRPYVEMLDQQLRGERPEMDDALTEVLEGASSAEVDVPVEERGLRRWYAVRFTPLRGSRGGAVVVHSDITERKRSEAELALKATHDTLTGVLNRLAIEEEVERALERARTGGAPVALLFIDLDGFKPINDTYGHAVGDEVLRAVANRVSGAVRTSDRVARMGGDEFVVLVGPLNRPGDAEVTARRILDALAEPVRTGGLSIPIAASIGVAVVEPDREGSPGTLIELADAAMYESKQRGGATYTVS